MKDDQEEGSSTASLARAPTCDFSNGSQIIDDFMSLYAAANKGRFAIGGDLNFLQIVKVDGETATDRIESGQRSIITTDGKERKAALVRSLT